MSTWWRAHNSSMHHRKLLKLSDAMHRAWYTLNCVASENGGALPPAKDIALELRIKAEKVAEWIANLVAAGLYDNNNGVFSPHNWDTRQYLVNEKDPTGARRSKDYRDRKRDASRRDDRDATSPQKQSRTDTEQSRADAPRAAVSNSEKVLRSDLMEIFGASKCPDLSRAGVWLGKGYSAGMIVEVVRELLARKPDIASLNYFDAKIEERHAKRAATPSERAAGVSPENMDWALGHFAKGGHWARSAGPEPGQPGCRATVEMLAKHGLGLDGQKLRADA